MRLNEETGLYENYGLWHVPFWQTEIFYIFVKICFVLAMCALLFFLYKIYRLYKKRKKISVWDIALQDLQKVMDVVSGDVADKEFYVAVASIVKIYIHNRFGYDVLGKTDNEIIAYLEEKNAEPTVIEAVRFILLENTEVKFAGKSVDRAQILTDYQSVFTFIKSTIPQKG